MEQLRKIFKQLRRAPEKVVFAIVVMVLIWRVVQIVWRPDGPPGDNDKPAVPIEKADVGQLDQPLDEALSRYADINVGKWNLHGGGPVSDDGDEGEDADLPDIQLERIEEAGGALYAWISVDGRTPQAKTKGKSFAKNKAILDEIHAEAGKIVFTWRPTNRKYERGTTG